MRTYYEIQTSRRGDRWGYAVTTSGDDSSWTSAWVAAGTTSDEAALIAREEIRALQDLNRSH